MRHASVCWLSIAMVVLPLTACRRNQPAQPAPVPVSTNPATRDDSGDPAPARPADDAAAEAARNRALLEARVHFEFDRHDLTPSAEAVLRAKVPVLRADPTIRIRIEGHADERGSVEYNLALGLRRAQSARDFLAGFGMDATRFVIETYGEDRPLETGSNEAAWARNRRAEFVITSGSLLR